MGMCNFTITRKKQFVASAVSLNVIIDGVDYGTIKNGSNLQCLLAEGNHVIDLKWWRAKHNPAYSFNIPSNMFSAQANVYFGILAEKFILRSDDMKIEEISCNIYDLSSRRLSKDKLPSTDHHSNICSTFSTTSQEAHCEGDTNNIISTSFDDLSGLEFENWCADLLRNNGFINVKVTRASGDQGVDILAEKGEIKYAIQCKCYSSDLGNSPVQEVHAGKSMYNCHVGAVMTNRHFTSGAKDLAKATGVLLWDREKLLQMMSKQETAISPCALNDADNHFRDALILFGALDRVNTSILQRNLMIGYGRAAKIIDKMEEMGIVSKADGGKPRRLLISKDDIMEIINSSNKG